MKDSKQSFTDLVKKMDSLEETQQGKLKGGFSTIVIFPKNRNEYKYSF